MRFFESAGEGWQLVSLFDLGTVDRGRSRHRPRHEPALYGGPYPFIQTGDIKASEGRIRAHRQTYNEMGLSQSRLWSAGAMCITIAANIAETAILTYPACFPDSVIGFIPDPNKADVYFVEYAFRNLKRRIQAITEDSGTVQDNINLEFLRHLQFPVPTSVGEQHAIREILCALDDRSELNRKMNRALEATASALFRSWFVDFDPVTAKAEGRKPFGMSDDVASLFPREFEDGAPSEWTNEPLSAIASQSKAQMNPRDARTVLFDHYSIPAYDEGKVPVREFGSSIQSNKFLVPENSILVSKLNPESPRVWWPLANVNAKCVCSTEFLVLQTKSGVPLSYLYCLMTAHSFRDELCGLVNGTSNSHQRVTPGDFMRIRFVRPPHKILVQFDRIVAPMFARIHLNSRQCLILNKLRDALLSPLISGELRLKEVEQQVEAALS